MKSAPLRRLSGLGQGEVGHPSIGDAFLAFVAAAAEAGDLEAELHYPSRRLQSCELDDIRLGFPEIKALPLWRTHWVRTKRADTTWESFDGGTAGCDHGC